MDLKFIADVHLGKLARYLRMLGFDTLYNNNFHPGELENISCREGRVLLSRNKAFEQNKNLQFFLITSQNPQIQLQTVIETYELKQGVKPFSRCMICNGNLDFKTPEELNELLQPNTKTYYHEFWQCTMCKHIYWKGSHYKRMIKMIERL